MTSEELIQHARESFKGEGPFDTELQALEAFYMNGFHDEADGDAEASTGHFYRVDRWIVITDSQGFHTLLSFDKPSQAQEDFDRRSDEFTEWLNASEGDC